MRKVSVGLLFAATAAAQTSPAPHFEVASIKPSIDLAAQFRSGRPPRIGLTIDDARFDIGYISLFQLICLSYRIKPYQVSGPDWMSDARFDISAKIPEGVSKYLVPDMMQALLTERFKLTIRHATREHNGYALLVATGGPRLKESPTDIRAAGEARPDNSVRPLFGPRTFGQASTAPDGSLRMPMGTHREYSRMSMTDLAELLSDLTNLPVVDMTQLQGNYDVALDIPRAATLEAARASGFLAPSAPDTSDDTSPSSGRAALLQSVLKLGLKLEQRRVPMELIVVEHVERTATEN